MRINWFRKTKQEEPTHQGIRTQSTYIPPNYDPTKRGGFNIYAETLDKSLKEKFAKSK